MKSKFFLIFLLIFSFSCKKKKVEPTPSAPVVNRGIKYINSTYSNVTLRYRLDGIHQMDSVSKGNTIKLTYVEGDSLHLELISNIGFSQKNITLPLEFKKEYPDYPYYSYTFYKPNSYTISIYEYTTGEKRCYLIYTRSIDAYNNEQINTDSLILAD